jgi:hypothetical protein
MTALVALTAAVAVALAMAGPLSARITTVAVSVIAQVAGSAVRPAMSVRTVLVGTLVVLRVGDACPDQHDRSDDRND